jgi:hypothetical protein
MAPKPSAAIRDAAQHSSRRVLPFVALFVPLVALTWVNQS